MLYARCPSCGHVLAHIQLPYEEKRTAILNDTRLSPEEMDAKIQQLNNSYSLKYCCKMRVMTYVNKTELTM